MTVFRRFAVVQLLMLWQGGFLFYATFVVPVGTEVLGGAFEQGRITRFVAENLNWVGAAATAVFAWDLIVARHFGWKRQWLWGSWLALTVSLIALFAVHLRLVELVDFKEATFEDRGRFRFWHRTYLWICTIQWLAGLVYAYSLICSWRDIDRLTSPARPSGAVAKGSGVDSQGRNDS